MPENPATERRRRVIVAGHEGDLDGARAGLTDADGVVRAAALGAVARLGALDAQALLVALSDPDAAVRRRALELSPAVGNPQGPTILAEAVRRCLADDDALVVESACWALAERDDRQAVLPIARVAGHHDDTRCREAAVAALGALGEPSGLEAVLAALEDKPTVRRRAVVALAAFEGPEVEAALRRSLEDRDWQVRQSAQILLGEDPS